MRQRISFVLFGLLLIFSLVTSTVVAQRLTPINPNLLLRCGDGSICTVVPLQTLPPVGQPGGNSNHSGDPDGDGIPNGIDQCPDQGGPSSNSGCPPGTGPAAAIEPLPVLPTLPSTGDCVLATTTSEGVNIHIQPSISAGIVGVLDSQTLYPVNGQQTDDDGLWYRVDEGWVANRVVRLGGFCDTLPEVTPSYSAVTIASLDTISCDDQELIRAINLASSGATINLSPGCIYTLESPYPSRDSFFGLPEINKTLKINGNGATIRRSSVGGTIDFGFFFVKNSATLTLNDLTLRNGKGATSLYPGGCSPCNASAIETDGGYLVLNNATLSNNTEDSAIANLYFADTITVTNSTFSHNSSRAGGGAISAAILTITNSTFSDNSASGFHDGQGGALYTSYTTIITDSTFSHNTAVGNTIGGTNGNGGAIFNIGTLTINNSTFSNNSANYGAGLENLGTATVSNSTFYGNVATNSGAAIYNPGTLTLTNSTVVSNRAVNGGGGIDNSGTNQPIPFQANKVMLGSSIVSDNGGLGPDLLGVFKSLGYNVIGTTIGATINGVTTSNLTDGAASPLNLGGLTSNGGPTQTLQIGAGSVAIRAGNCTSMAGMTPVTTDQRGSTRKPTCDVGAYESLGAFQS